MYKILHLCDSSFKQNTGTGVVIPQYAKYQSKLANVTLLNMNNVKIKDLDNINQYTNIDFKTFSNERKMEILDFDLCVIHTVYSLRIVLFWLVYLKKKRKYVLLPHGSFTKTSQSKSKLKKNLFNFIFLDSMVRNCKAIHYLTTNEMKNSIYSTKADFVIPNGISIPKYRITNNKKFIYTYIGRFDMYYKGLDILLESIGKLKKSNKLPRQFRLNLYGTDVENSKNKMLEIITRLGLNEIVSINDPVYGENKINVLLNSTYFIQTSRSEGLPLGIIEALSYGLPVVITETTNLSDIILQNQCGYTSQCNVDSISDAILKSICYIKEWENLSNQAVLCSRNYYWDNVSIRCLKKYTDLIEGD